MDKMLAVEVQVINVVGEKVRRRKMKNNRGSNRCVK